MAGEFLLLMVFLDKVWFGPVGRVLDARDADLRSKLGLVKNNGSEVGPGGVGCYMLTQGR
jgi:F-type H+-transporting ATPase subunit b